MSTDNGVTWTNLSAVTTIPTSDRSYNSQQYLTGVTLGKPMLLVRLHFTNGQSNGNDPQNLIDNIQVNGTAVPEPATVAGGLLGVLGLCWFQRRRLIRSCACGARNAIFCWGARASRVLVSASRRNDLHVRQPVRSEV